MKILRNTFYLILGLLIAYYCIACYRYRFMHPNQTETELLLNLPDALAWHDGEETHEATDAR